MEEELKKKEEKIYCQSCLLSGMKRKGFKHQDNLCNYCYDNNRESKGYFHVVKKVRF